MVAPHMYISNLSKLLIINWMKMIVTSHELGDLGNSQKETSAQNCQSSQSWPQYFFQRAFFLQSVFLQSVFLRSEPGLHILSMPI